MTAAERATAAVTPSGPPADWRPAPLLPRGEGERALVFVVAVLCALSCVCVVGAQAVSRAARGWTGELVAAATVEVRAHPGETPSEAAGRAAEALAAVPGVEEARALDRKVATDLLAPWFGHDGVPDDLPIPQLVAVELDRHTPATPDSLRAGLTRAGVEATVDDHSRWMGDVRRAAAGVATGSIAAAAVVAAAAAAVIAFATRAQLAARRDVVEVLQLTGARDDFTAGLFVRRFAGLAFRAGVYGAIAAAAVAAAARGFGGADGFTPTAPVVWTDLLSLVACPAIAAAIAAWAARRTALAILRSRI